MIRLDKVTFSTDLDTASFGPCEFRQPACWIEQLCDSTVLVTSLDV